jgi:hypothetical protein
LQKEEKKKKNTGTAAGNEDRDFPRAMTIDLVEVTPAYQPS